MFLDKMFTSSFGSFEKIISNNIEDCGFYFLVLRRFEPNSLKRIEAPSTPNTLVLCFTLGEMFLVINLPKYSMNRKPRFVICSANSRYIAYGRTVEMPDAFYSVPQQLWKDAERFVNLVEGGTLQAENYTFG